MTGAKKSVRRAYITDAPDLVRLNEAFNGVRMTEEEVRDSLLRSNELVAIALLDEHPAAFACAQYFESFCYRERHGELTEMFVEPSARGQGLASMLMAHMEEELRTRGVNHIKVLTGADNDIAIKAYERFLYARKNEAVLMKNITPSPSEGSGQD
ncbi:GNAT family N-acetyltransferase [Paenibacillus kobensis]|uniref:GNAT family N-acetyltransferase n=1 Tax=Paenibacillus kobensis TaxID=59841 RepID=UPI000FD7BDA4|nr:GNAT family N-acetyltransferase [Paenibacillus kobensis]